MEFFQDLRVIDLTQVWIGPLVTRILSNLGADVIKVERPSKPDPVRAGFPAGNDSAGDFWNRSAYFISRNAGKRAMMLDLSSEDGRAILWRLLESADVLVENFTPHVLARLGFGYERLQQRYPRLIVLSISGYGQHGPRADRPAFGMSMEPAAGVASVTGYADGGPLKTGQTWVDPFAGLYATGALIAALLRREETGRGQYVDISMQESTIPLLAEFVSDYLLNGRLRHGNGNRRPGMVRGSYPCRGDDDWAAISIRTDRQWEAFCVAVGHDEWLSDPRFRNLPSREAHHDELDRLIAEWTRGRTKFEVMRLLQGAGIPCGAVLKADEVIKNEQLAARAFFDRLPIPDFGSVPVQRYFTPKVDGQGFGPRASAPKLGEHTDEVLKELGIDDVEISRLKQAGVIDGVPDLWPLPAVREAVRLPIERFQEMGSVLRIDPAFRPV